MAWNYATLTMGFLKEKILGQKLTETSGMNIARSTNTSDSDSYQ